MGLLNVGRKELAHSSFISWLFDSTTFNQSHTDSPIMHLLDIAVKRANQQKKIGESNPISTSLSESIYRSVLLVSYQLDKFLGIIATAVNGDVPMSDVVEYKS